VHHGTQAAGPWLKERSELSRTLALLQWERVFRIALARENAHGLADRIRNALRWA